MIRPDATVIFTEDADWHTNRLRAALVREGFGVQVLSLNDCGFDVAGTGHGLRLPGFGRDLPALVFVRLIAKGSTEQITHRLGLLHALRELGVRVVNDARAIERCVDKSMTTFLLHRAGLPTPETITGEDAVAMQAELSAMPRAGVLKPLFGAQGRGLRRLGRDEALPEPEAVNGVYYLQRFVGRLDANRYHDMRVLVAGTRPVAAMRRNADDWITNIHQGATGEALDVTDDMADLATRATTAVGADYAGVDLIADETGRLFVLEVNSMPAWKGLQAATGIDIAAALARHVAGLVGEPARP